MRLFFSVIFLFIFSGVFAQTKVDTIHCGNNIGYGKVVDGKKEGKWKYYGKSEYAPTYTGNYHQGEKTGEWIISGFFLSEKTILHYENNLLNGTVISYLGKELNYKGSYSNGLKDGEWIYYFSDGRTISSLQYFQKGNPIGKWKEFVSPTELWSGKMNAYGRNGYWLHKDTTYSEDPNNPGILHFEKSIADSFLYVNGKKEGFWIDQESWNKSESREGNYSNGKKEGRWIETDFWKYSTRDIAEYKNGLREGNDTLWENDTISEIDFYSEDKIDGPQFLFNDGKLIAEGISVPNPKHVFDLFNHLNYVEVPEFMAVDLIENEICDPRLFSLRGSEENISAQIRDSLIQLLKHKTYVKNSAYDTSAFLLTTRTGHWNLYWENGNKQAEGNYLPIVKDSLVWDSTHEVEDPNNPGTFIMAPLETDYPVYSKTGSWNYYNEQGVLIREERFDEKGILVETKKY